MFFIFEDEILENVFHRLSATLNELHKFALVIKQHASDVVGKIVFPRALQDSFKITGIHMGRHTGAAVQ